MLEEILATALANRYDRHHALELLCQVLETNVISDAHRTVILEQFTELCEK